MKVCPIRPPRVCSAPVHGHAPSRAGGSLRELDDDGKVAVANEVMFTLAVSGARFESMPPEAAPTDRGACAVQVLQVRRSTSRTYMARQHRPQCSQWEDDADTPLLGSTVHSAVREILATLFCCESISGGVLLSVFAPPYLQIQANKYGT